MDIAPEFGDWVARWHAPIMALWIVMDFLHLVPSAGLEMAIVLISIHPILKMVGF